MNEAHFVELAARKGLLLYPRDGAPHTGIAGYSAAATDYLESDRREYAGLSLAPDLSLDRLRAAWHGKAIETREHRTAHQKDALLTWLSKSAQ
ncbi:hypothetical protein, partial [Blastococcus sp. KM273128]|uniref:hypothetical protein n=1 Tax=Blastococcus sp. KM273128 TaxID=2570314 RepID=UPI001F1FE16D